MKQSELRNGQPVFDDSDMAFFYDAKLKCLRRNGGELLRATFAGCNGWKVWGPDGWESVTDALPEPTRTDTETLARAMDNIARGCFSRGGTASAAAIAEAAERLRELEIPDMWWDWDDTEQPFDMDEPANCEPGTVMQFEVARRLPDKFMVATGDSDDPWRDATPKEVEAFKAERKRQRDEARKQYEADAAEIQAQAKRAYEARVAAAARQAK